MSERQTGKESHTDQGDQDLEVLGLLFRLAD
jgi:hypothetical protein